MRTLVDGQLRMLEHIGQRIEQLECEIAALQKQLTRRTRTGPGARHWRARIERAGGHTGRCQGLALGREFSASIGLVPAHGGTGGKVRVGHLSKRGDPYLRTLLIHGARSVIEHAKDKPKWLQELLARRPTERGGGGAGQQDGTHGLGVGRSWPGVSAGLAKRQARERRCASGGRVDQSTEKEWTPQRVRESSR